MDRTAKIMRRTLGAELAVITGITVFIILEPGWAGEHAFYELFGALLAAIITTYGIYKMRDIT
jgi:hypothetical protein